MRFNKLKTGERSLGQGPAFTLIEMVGVLAIVAILAAIFVPRLMTRATEATRSKEGTDLETIRQALVRYIQKNKRVPAASSWATNVAAELSYPVANVLSVNGNTRVYLVHPSLSLGTPPSSTLPYVQTSAGSADPGADARILLISSTDGALPVTSGAAASAAAFNEIWNVADNQKPASWSSYAASGQDIKIERVNIGTMMHSVLLNDLDTDAVAWYAADGNPTNAVTAGNIERWFFETTVLGLWSGGSVQLQEHLDENKSYFYEDEIWSDFMRVGPPVFSADAEAEEQFLILTDEFVQKNGFNGYTTQQVTDAFYWYLTTYTAWADSEFTNSLRLQVVLGAQTILETYLNGIKP